MAVLLLNSTLTDTSPDLTHRWLMKKWDSTMIPKLKIQEVRAIVETELRDDIHIRDFYKTVLNSGQQSIAILEAKKDLNSGIEFFRN